jgi:hypothetical protein
VSERTYRDVFGNAIALADSVREVILLKHPEAADFVDRIDKVLLEPDEVHRSVRDERSILYYRFEHDLLNGKWIVIVVKRVDRHFISTIYVTDQIKSGDVLWKKNT